MADVIRLKTVPGDVTDLLIQLARLTDASIRIETDERPQPSGVSSHPAYHLGTSDLVVIVLTFSSLAASVAALAAAIASYAQVRRPKHNEGRSFRLVVNGSFEFDVNDETTGADLVDALSRMPLKEMRFVSVRPAAGGHVQAATTVLASEAESQSGTRTSPLVRRTRVFISYAHADNDSRSSSERWLDRLQKHLAPLVSQGDISVWSDRELGLGGQWKSMVASELGGATAAIILVSPAFLASEYVRNSELPILLRRAVDDGVVIIPIIIRPCLFSEARFRFPDPRLGPSEFRLSDLQAANPPSLSLVEMSEGEQERVLLAVAQRVRELSGS